jgi:hypothetical protein
MAVQLEACGLKRCSGIEEFSRPAKQLSNASVVQGAAILVDFEFIVARFRRVKGVFFILDAGS